MTYMKRVLLITTVGLLVAVALAFGQKKPHGMFEEERSGIHNGNRIQTTFYNSGLVGRVTSKPEDIGGEWPINSGHEYIGDQLMMVGAEITDLRGEIKHSVVTPRGPIAGARTGDKSADGQTWYTWEALPGYAGKDTNLVAMSHLPVSWPAFWPDKVNVPNDPGWRNDAEDDNPNRAAWNGYFGKNVFNADQESYFVMDDYNDARYEFLPDSTDKDRRGLGLQAASRGFQWSQVLAQDVLFFVYDVTNIGTTTYDKVAYSMICGYMTGGDGEDDNASFSKKDNITYTWDFDNIGSGGWSPVGYAACAFLESPGNPYDGIDNDNDAVDMAGPTISESMFKAKTLVAGSDVVVINYKTYERKVMKMPADQLVITGPKGQKIAFAPNQSVEEIPNNLIDDNLDGLIDENNGSNVQLSPGVYQKTYLYVGLKYKDYISGDGLLNKLIDERRDDKIDNDGDWSAVNDDVGLDGKFGTFDDGEGDGFPTSGANTDAPGEPHIDKTDVTESDQLGLTSFYYFYPYNLFALREDDKLWSYMTPGYFNGTASKVDGDWIYSAGYFTLKPGQTERISVAILFGDNLQKVVDTKRTVQRIYDENYNFAKAPELPTVWASTGDGEVTIYWDDVAEKSVDVISGYDFEGYRIYRASDPGFKDAAPITDRFGTRIMDTPIAQYDKKNGVKGFYPESFGGAEFYLGDDSGLRHSYRDTTVSNGFTYYYAVTAFDHGDQYNEIQPSETSKFAATSKSGDVQLARNVVVVRPEAKAAGYLQRDLINVLPAQTGNIGTGKVSVEIVDEKLVPQEHSYEIRFKDTASDGVDNDFDWNATSDDVGADGVKNTHDAGEGDGLPTVGEPNLDAKDMQEIVPLTSSYGVIDVTNSSKPDTLFFRNLVEAMKRKGVAIPDTLANRILDQDGGRDFFGGMRLNLANDWDVQRVFSLSNWNITRTGANENYSFVLDVFKAAGIYSKGVAYPVDYRIVCLDATDGMSAPLTLYRANPDGSQGAALNIAATKTNFKVIDGNSKKEVLYGFLDSSLRPSFIQPGILSNFDRILFFETVGNQPLITWSLSFFGNDTTAYKPKAGDTLRIATTRPFSHSDVFRFTSKAAAVDPALASRQLDLIKVVPNPYVGAAQWEPRNPFDTGRGPRELHFTHLPMRCTIRIYTVQGELVKVLEHHTTFDNGTETWDMLTKDNLDIAYGVYVYHIDAPNVGHRVGKFAVIK
jgi:hypothetical protein